MLKLLREGQTTGDRIVIAGLAVLVVAVPIMNLLVPEDSAAHVSTTFPKASCVVR